ncbi:MAG TPA: hypothetical protein PKE06_08650 [Flavilitoribacter sp.]|nr:hypothetical protein [Flavilitoribacter sp.]HMQ89507.1 hypothetical protein [Flavilitoribacter sp.]
MEITPETLWQDITDFFRNLEPEHWGIGGISLLLIIILFRFTRRKKKDKPIAAAPSGGLQINVFQIAPLGRDAFLKLFNPGPPVTLSKLDIVGRQDIAVKNALAGHLIETGALYSLLMEATGAARLDTNFTMAITYIDASGTAWKQTLDPATQLQKAPKIVKK